MMAQIINPKVEVEIIRTTSFLSKYFSGKGESNLLAICRDERISIITDDYQDFFDGMLAWDGEKFFIHLNTKKGNTIDSRRGRFTIAHELGHYFIDYHNKGIRTGNIPVHASNLSLSHSDEIEREADYFAANLLMPRDKLRALTGGKKFSIDRIIELSNFFNVSLTSAVLRFIEVGTHEIMAVFSKNGIIEYSFRSYDFPRLANNFKRGSKVPSTTVAGESYLKDNAKYTSIEPIDLEDWFEYRGWQPERQLYEQCFYSATYNSVVSIIWFH
ncbi:hypothetical protein GCM10028807_49820 [Spirosoma daeguense]